MTNSSLALPLRAAPTLARHPLVERYAPLATTILALIAIWYVAAVAMNWALVRDGFEREETPYALSDVLTGTMEAERPLVPAPHQVVTAFLEFSVRLSAAGAAQPGLSFAGYAVGNLYRLRARRGVRDRAGADDHSQPGARTEPVALDHLLADGAGSGAGADLHRRARRAGLHGLLPKSIISAYLCFFPVAIGMVKGFTSPDPLQVELMRTWSATPRRCCGNCAGRPRCPSSSPA